jgi:hypothetical protein
LKWPKAKAPYESSTSTPTTAKKPKTSQLSVFYYLKRESLGELLTKCAAEDGFSIRAITKSFAIREFITMVFSKYYILAAKVTVTVTVHI